MQLDASITAVVTGGASGLGAATARRLASHGVKVALFDLNAELGERVAGDIGGVFCKVDVTSDAEVDAGFSRSRGLIGQERILVNCAGIAQSLTNAQITFDKFHLVKLINEAVDAVRRAEQKSHAELNKSRYLWLKNPRNLSERQRAQLDNLSALNLKTGRAYRIRLAFQELYVQPAKNAEAFLKKWYWWATHSRLPPMIEAARMVKRHWNGILRWFQTKIANGIMEAINSLVQAAKAKARGYRSTRNLKAIIYLARFSHTGSDFRAAAAGRITEGLKERGL